jgi:hypothetical protein
MPYVRISLMIPKSGQAAEAGRLLDAVAHLCEGQPGFIRGYRLERSDDTGRIGRVTIWQDEHSADLMAQTDKMLALRSALNSIVRKGTHQEHGFWAYDTSNIAENSGRDAGTQLSVEEVLTSVDRIIHGDS